MRQSLPNRPPSYQNPVFGQWLTVEESKELAGSNQARDLRNLARAGMSPFPQTPSTLPESTVAPGPSLALRSANEVVKAGDEIAIEFRITNTGTNEYKYANRTYDRSGRMDEYQLTATNDLGGAVPDPRANNKGFWQLIAIANDPGNIGRNSAIHALAFNRTDAGVATLRHCSMIPT